MTNVERKILGFSDSQSFFVPPWKQPIYFRLLLSLSSKKRPIVYYIGAAHGDNPQKISEFYELANRASCEPRTFRLFKMETNDPEKYFLDADIIFIDGGATRNLITLMADWNAIDPLVNAYRSGVVIGGASAGMSMLFQNYISDSVQTQILSLKGVGLLKGSFCAHYDIRPERRAVLRELISGDESAIPAYGLDDGVAAYFLNETLSKAYTLHDNACLHSFTTLNGRIRHEKRQPQCASKTHTPNAINVIAEQEYDLYSATKKGSA